MKMGLCASCIEVEADSPFCGKRAGAALGEDFVEQAGGEVVIEKSVTIDNKYGLHARPAMQFVELATKYSSQVSLSRGDKVADAKSIMEVLMLAAEKGSELSIRADGDDAEQAVDALLKLVASKFDEE